MRFVFCLILLVLPYCGMAQYAGPAILSRGEAPAALKSPEVNFRPYAEISGIYDGGLQGVSLTEQGRLADEGSAGLQLRWGVSGAHSWRHTKLGLDYRGSLTHYQTSYFDSIDQALLLGLSRQVSRHAVLTLRESAGTYGRNFQVPGLSQTVPFDPVASNIPTIDYFDNRTYYASTQADFTIQRTARLAFNIGGDGFVTRRRASALTGVVGASARGDVEYRATRRTTIGANYTYSHYDFTNAFGGTDLVGFNGVYSARLTRSVEFSGYGGIMRAESSFVHQSAVDPVIAALLGITATPQHVYTADWRPNAAGRLSKTYHAGIAYVSGGHTVTPGNGLFLTSFMTSVTGGYTYTGLRRWAFSANAGYWNGTATGTIAGKYGTGTGYVTISRLLRGSVHFISEAGIRRYSSPDFTGYNRTVFYFRAGLGITPGNLPFRMW